METGSLPPFPTQELISIPPISAVSIGTAERYLESVKYPTTPVSLISPAGSPVLLYADGPLTIERILQDYELSLQFWSSSERRQKLIQDSHKQRLRQQQLLSQKWGQTCPTSVMFQVGYDHSGIDGKTLQLIAKDRFYDPQIMKDVQCLVGGLVMVPNSLTLGATAGERVRYWLSDRKWLASGVHGNVSTSNLNGAKDIFAVKVSDEYAEMLHELFVGFQLNSLRASIPNFAYVYAGFDCNNPLNTKELDGWCWKVGSTDFSRISSILYENITPSITLYQYLDQGASFDQWLNIYLQIVLAFRLANKQLDFTHYDLHLRNVLIRDINSSTTFYIRYPTTNGDIYLLSDRIATIIDYGFSHIKVDGENFGVYKFRQYGVDPYKSRIIADLYHLLLSTLEIWYKSSMKTNDWDRVNKLTPILQFFFTDLSTEPKIDELIYDLMDDPIKDTKYALPEISEIDQIPIDQLIDYILKVYQPNFVQHHPSSGSRILGCSGNDMCISTAFNYSDIGVGLRRPTTMFEFYDLHSHLIKSKNIKEADKIADEFYLTYFSELPSQYSIFKNLILVSKRVTKRNNWINIQGTSSEALKSSAKLINDYRSQLVSFLKKYDILWNIFTNYKMLVYLDKIYAKLQLLHSSITMEDVTKIINDSIKPISNLYNLLMKYRNKINLDLNYIIKLAKDNPEFKNSYYYSRWMQLNNFLMMTPLPQLSI